MQEQERIDKILDDDHLLEQFTELLLDEIFNAYLENNHADSFLLPFAAGV